jgi:3-hydroxymyristoyl/3-hydroxydecanoyl-(acyl carrier protein) dehydratase
MASAAPAVPEFTAFRIAGGHGPATVFAVPSAGGARIYRRHGMTGLRARVGAWLDSVAGPEAVLHVVNELPTAAIPDTTRPLGPRIIRAEKAGAQLTAVIDVPYDLAIFKGHFPHVPIVPGAMLVGWICNLAADAGMWPRDGLEANAVKFRRIVQPGVRLDIGIAVDADAGRLDFTITSDGGLHSSGTLLRPPP